MFEFRLRRNFFFIFSFSFFCFSFSKSYEWISLDNGEKLFENFQLYRNFLHENPPNHSYAVLFVSSVEKHGCHICPKAIQEFQNFFQKDHQLTISSIRKNPIQGLLIDFQAFPEAFTWHQMNSIPTLLIIPSTLLANSSQRKAFLTSSSHQNHFRLSISPQKLNSNLFSSFLSSIEKNNEKESIPEEEVPFVFEKIWIGIWMILIGWVTYQMSLALLDNWQTIETLIFQNVVLWRTFSMGILFLSLSGSMYTFLVGVPPFYIGGGGFYFFHPRSTSQFAFEGWLMGFFIMISSYAVCGFTHILPNFSNKSFHSNVQFHPNPNPLPPNIDPNDNRRTFDWYQLFSFQTRKEKAFCIFLLIFCISFHMVRFGFIGKNPWFMYN